jgi:hypothetical protein
MLSLLFSIHPRYILHGHTHYKIYLCSKVKQMSLNTRFGHPSKFSGALTVDDVAIHSHRNGALRLPSATTAQIAALVDPADGTMVYDSDIDDIFVRTGGAWTKVGSGAAAAPPPAAGADTQVQYNDGGAMAGDAALTFAKGTGKLTVGSGVLTNDISSKAAGESMGVFAGDVTTGTGGLLTAAGGGNTSASDGEGGQLYLRGGAGNSGGEASLVAGALGTDGDEGASIVLGGAFAGAGGTATLAGGRITAGTNDGGEAAVVGGRVTAGSGNGGNLVLQSGEGGPDAGGNCGDLSIAAASGAGGTDGQVSVATRGITYNWPFAAAAPSVGDIMVVSAVNGSTATLEFSSTIQAQIDDIAADVITAQTTANTGVANAATAQTAADDAQADADTAQTRADAAYDVGEPNFATMTASRDGEGSTAQSVGSFARFPSTDNSFNVFGNIAHDSGNGLWTVAANGVYEISFGMSMWWGGSSLATDYAEWTLIANSVPIDGDGIRQYPAGVPAGASTDHDQMSASPTKSFTWNNGSITVFGIQLKAASGSPNVRSWSWATVTRLK